MRCSRWPDRGPAARCAVRPSSLVAMAQIIATGLLVSACASSQAAYHTSAYDTPARVGAHPSQQVAISAPQKVELEGDGLAVQAPPRKRRHSEPDDPSEPFSPNYGPAPEGSDPARKAAPPARRASTDGPVILRSRTTPMTDSEIRAIMARAMVAHELRHP